MINANLNGFEKIPQTLPAFCFEAWRRHAKSDALSYKINDVWHHLSGAAVIEKFKHIALGLADLGVRAGDRVAIISENRPEWSLTDLAILSLRAVNVPIYTTQAVEQIRFILEDSGAKILCVSGKKILRHAENAIASVERLEKLIFFDADAIPEDSSKSLSLAQIERRGEQLDEIDSTAFDAHFAQLKTDDLATIIYTSGTTGEPKGVMLSHENFTRLNSCPRVWRKFARRL